MKVFYLIILTTFCSCALPPHEDGPKTVMARAVASENSKLEQSMVMHDFEEKLFKLYSYAFMAEFKSSPEVKKVALKFRAKTEKEIEKLTTSSPYQDHFKKRLSAFSDESSIKAHVLRNLALALHVEDLHDGQHYSQMQLEDEYQNLLENNSFKVYQANIEHMAHLSSFKSKD